MILPFKKIRVGKQGQVIGLLAYGLATVFIAISFLFLAFFISEFNDVIQSSDQFSDQQKTYLSDTDAIMPSVLDSSYALMVVLSAIVLVASVLFIDTSMLFIAITLPVFLIVILANAIFANLIDEFGSTSALIGIYVQFPMMQFFAQHWVLITVVVGFTSIIAFFGGKSLRG